MSETTHNSSVQEEKPTYLEVLEAWDTLSEDDLDTYAQGNYGKKGDMLSLVEEWHGLEDEFVKGVELLKPEIEANRWSGIIADDTRGRFPAMVVRGVISRATHSAHKSIPLTFIAGDKYIQRWGDKPINILGGGGGKKPSARPKDIYDNYLSELEKLYAGKRVLIVTERVSSGGNAQHLADEFNRHHIKIDLLSFGADKGEGELSFLKNTDPEANIYSPKVFGIDNLLDYFRYRQFSFDYPLSKDHIWYDDPSAPQYNGKHIPVAEAQTGSEEYKLMRELSSRMAERVYERVFTPEQPNLG